MIKVRNVHKRFEDMDVLSKVSFTVQKGSIYGLLGSNGAGKTTLLKSIAGVYQTGKGSIIIDQQQVFKNTAIKDRMIFTRYAFLLFTL